MVLALADAGPCDTASEGQFVVTTDDRFRSPLKNRLSKALNAILRRTVFRVRA